MSVCLVLATGDPSSSTSFAAYSRIVDLAFPVRRGDTLLCDITTDLNVPTVTVDTRVGGDTPVLLVYSDQPLGSDVATALATSHHWTPARLAYGLHGDAIGVFLDGDNDWIFVEQWPTFSCEQLQTMVEMGLIDDLPRLALTADQSTTTPLGTTTSDAVIVPFPSRRQRAAVNE